MFKLQSPSKYSPSDATYLTRHFLTAQNSFWTHRFWCLLVFLPFFCFPSSILGKHFPFSTFFIWGNKWTKSCLGPDPVNREGGAQGSCCFWLKTAEHSAYMGRWSHKSSIMKWANAVKESSKNFTEANHSLSQQCPLVQWYRWVPRILT